MDDDDDPSNRILAAMERATGWSKSRLRRHVSYEQEHDNYVNATDLSLIDCHALVKLPREIGLLHQLVELRVSSDKLKRVPREIGQLKRLEFLSVFYCRKIIAFPDEVCELRSLTGLNLFGCTALKSLPAGIGQLKQLKFLCLSSCSSLTELPVGIGQLQQLEGLNLQWCSKLKELPDQVWQLTNLAGLNLHGCGSLTALSPKIGQLQQLKRLDLQDCWELTKLPIEIGTLSQLQVLILDSSSSGLDEFLRVAVCNLVNLTRLDITRSDEMPSKMGWLTKLPPKMGLLKKLEHLDLSDCEQLKFIPKEILELPSLYYLNLEGCSSLSITPKDIGEVSYSIQHVDMPTYDEETFGEMRCYIRMNEAGRHLLHRHDVPPALWPHVLAGPRSDENFILWFLMNNPDFVKKGESKE